MFKKISTVRDVICLHPFYFMEFTTNGDVYTCCPSWTRSSIGNIRRNTIKEIWNSKRAISIREKMYKGRWQKICNPVCPLISFYRHSSQLISFENLEQYDYLTPHLIDEIRQKKLRLESSPTVFNMSNSKICNLSCIMCVRDSQADDPVLTKKIAVDLMTHLPYAKRIVMSGMGDPFARHDTREILINYRPDNPHLQIELITNGLLLPKYWEKVKHHNFETLLVSVDAATKETYERIRQGGKWQDILSSLHFIQRESHRFSSITINMTVMRENYREIPDFIKLAESLGFNVSFQRIRGACGNENIFEMNDTRALKELSSIILHENNKERTTNVFWGDLYEFIDKRPLIDHHSLKIPDKGLRTFRQVLRNLKRLIN